MPMNKMVFLPGFEHVNRFFDAKQNRLTVKILPGEYYVSIQGELITTVLGSCISVCVYDSEHGIGGMNHFMLPTHLQGPDELISDSFRYGDVAMARLINDLIKLGARRHRLRFKAFGGGQIVEKMTPIGQRNISFLERFMALEGLHLEASDLGGCQPRKVRFDSATGRVWVKKLAHLPNNTVLQRETRYADVLLHDGVGSGDVELFE